MAETIKNTEEKEDGIQTEQEKLESVKRADAAVKSMHDFTSPEVLYQRADKQCAEVSSFHGYFYD